jgi:hypothetical protein
VCVCVCVCERRCNAGNQIINPFPKPSSYAPASAPKDKSHPIHPPTITRPQSCLPP